MRVETAKLKMVPTTATVLLMPLMNPILPIDAAESVTAFPGTPTSRCGWVGEAPAKKATTQLLERTLHVYDSAVDDKQDVADDMFPKFPGYAESASAEPLHVVPARPDLGRTIQKCLAS